MHCLSVETTTSPIRPVFSCQWSATVRGQTGQGDVNNNSLITLGAELFSADPISLCGGGDYKCDSFVTTQSRKNN